MRHAERDDSGFILRPYVQVALPILKRLGLPATFFVSTGFTEGGTMFNDGVIEAVRRAPAGKYDLSSLGLGSHTVSDSMSRRAAIDAPIRQLKYRPADERNTLVCSSPKRCTRPFQWT